MPLIGWLVTGVTGLFKGFFSFKEAQANVVTEAIKTLSSVNATDGESAQAASVVLSQILTQGSWLERNWRPLLMILIIGIIASFWYGYAPPYIDKPMSPIMERMFTMIEIGLGGYLPLRSIDKWVKMFQVGSILKTLINKKVM